MEIEFDGQKFKSEKERNKYCYYNLKKLKEEYNNKQDFKSAVIIMVPLFLSFILTYLLNLAIFLILGFAWMFYYAIIYKNKLAKEILSWAENYKENYDEEIERQKRMVQEYERKCNKCGTVWNSLVSDEKNLVSQRRSNALIGLGSMGSPVGAAFSNKSLDIGHQLQNLKKCPKCGSQDFSENITEFEKKN